MRVDHHLLRRMLETIEAAPTAQITHMPELTGEPEAQHYHLRLLIDGGYVTAQQPRPGEAPCALALTMAGQELLDKLRRGKSARRVHLWLERLVTAGVTRLLLGP